MLMLDRLNACNDVVIKDIACPEFQTYGKILTDFDMSGLVEYMEKNTIIPEQGNIYIPSDPAMESLEVSRHIQESVYGGMDIQVGYCNGRNSTYNGFEYHKGSEINIAVTDCMMVLGHSWDIKDNNYDTSQPEVFFVKKGTAMEMYQTTLHLSPCKVTESGFKAVVVLPRGTNTPLEFKKEIRTKEDELLLFKNKWILTHKDREPLVKAGAYIGVTGENIELKY